MLRSLYKFLISVKIKLDLNLKNLNIYYYLFIIYSLPNFRNFIYQINIFIFPETNK